MAVKISKVIADLNVGRQTIEEFLHKYGIEIEPSINARVPDDVYQMLVKEFTPDKEKRLLSRKMYMERQKEREKEKQISREAHEIKTVIPGQKPKILGKIDLSPKQSARAEKLQDNKVVESNEQAQKPNNPDRIVFDPSQAQIDTAIDMLEMQNLSSEQNQNDLDNTVSDSSNFNIFEKEYYKLLSYI